MLNGINVQYGDPKNLISAHLAQQSNNRANSIDLDEERGKAVAPMNLRVLFFSVLQDITGTTAIDVPCFEGATVTDLLQLLYAKWPAMATWDSSLLIAVDQTYVKRTAMLSANCEIAIMPPVQGG